ncbi:transglycosylase SLT domain-containing protein [Lichenicoccus sp.]|uniref:lytic transglycosylase domain-containing protein n=1 Tax=Lichenicoccus sp. TaxID=2781899 RepID=UPI003D13EE1F
MLASAVILAGAICTPVLARHQDDATQASPDADIRSPPVEVASASFGLGAGLGAGEAAALPQPLDGADAARIRRIFALQSSGDLAAAARETAQLHDDILLADILADRALQPFAHPAADELSRWLHRWPEHPDAPLIRHRLADLLHQRSRANDAGALAATRLGAEPPMTAPPEEADPAATTLRRNRLLDRTVRERLQQGPAGARSALRLVAQTRFPDRLYAAMLRAEIARTLFSHGDDAAALQAARAASEQAHDRIGLAGYIAGLAEWRQGHRAAATRRFEAASRGDLAAASVHSGAAFWAARGHAAAGDAAGARSWLERAASFPHTFYGLLAGQVLGGQVLGGQVLGAPGAGAPQPGQPLLGEIDVEAVAALPDGRRAFALLQVGQPGRAEAALRALWPGVRGDAALCRSVALVARAAGMSSLSAQLATVLQVQDRAVGDGRDHTAAPLDAVRFPMPRLQPRRGFTINPALVYALTRVESNFDTQAVSGAGAHGLMQVMPVTARFMQDQGAPGHRPAPVSPDRLRSPAVNLELGQDYVLYLAGQDGIRGDLIRLLASYNAGPNALAGWGLASGSAASAGDPLLFIESLPNTETRNFVHRALAYLWIYAARMDRPDPSLDTLAQGGWPRFDDEQRRARIVPAASTGRQ